MSKNIVKEYTQDDIETMLIIKSFQAAHVSGHAYKAEVAHYDGKVFVTLVPKQNATKD